MTIPVTVWGPRTPADEAYGLAVYGPSWLPSIQSPSGTPPTIASVVASAIPNDVTIASTVLIGSSLYLKPTGGTPGTTYSYPVQITLSDGQVISRSIQQSCEAVGTL
jgi:hypothetical protein